MSNICQYKQKKFILIAFLVFSLFFLMYGLASAQSIPDEDLLSNSEMNAAALKLLRVTFNQTYKTIEKNIALLEKQALSYAPKEQKDAIEKAFKDTRAELLVIFEEEFIESCKRGACRIEEIELDIKTIEDAIATIYKKEITAGCTRAKCSAKEIQEAAEAYIIKKYIVIPKLQEYSVFVKDAMKLIDGKKKIVDQITEDIQKEIRRSWFGNGLRRTVVDLMIQASGQLDKGNIHLNKINKELIAIEKGIKENSISAEDIQSALARIKTDMRIFQGHRRVNGIKDEGIGENLLRILNNAQLKRAIDIKNKELSEQGKPEIDLQEYIISIQQLTGQVAHYIDDIDTYAESDGIKKLYAILPIFVDVDKPLVFPPRKPPAQPTSPSGVSAGETLLTETERAKAEREAFIQAQERARENPITIVYLGNSEAIKEGSKIKADSWLNTLKNADGINVLIAGIKSAPGRLDWSIVQEYCNGIVCPFNTINNTTHFSRLPPGLDYKSLISNDPTFLIIIYKNGEYIPLDFKTKENLKEWLASQKKSIKEISLPPPPSPKPPVSNVPKLNKSADPFAQPPPVIQQQKKIIIYTGTITSGNKSWCGGCNKLKEDTHWIPLLRLCEKSGCLVEIHYLNPDLTLESIETMDGKKLPSLRGDPIDLSVLPNISFNDEPLLADSTNRLAMSKSGKGMLNPLFNEMIRKFAEQNAASVKPPLGSKPVCDSCKKLEDALNRRFNDWRKYIDMENPQNLPSGVIPCLTNITDSEVNECFTYLSNYITNAKKQEELQRKQGMAPKSKEMSLDEKRAHAKELQRELTP